MVASICYQIIGSVSDRRRYPPHGKLVDVGGYRLHISVSGEGEPTVILDTGLGHTSQIWGLVQSEVASFTRVCSYDRAGYGWSDPRSSPRTSIQIVEELHKLLKNAGLPGPYVLVGHSFGGLNMYLYALRYPNEVAGLVLVDAVSYDTLTLSMSELQQFAAVNRIRFHALSFANRLGLFRLFARVRGMDAVMDFIKHLPIDSQQATLSSFMRKTFAAAASESTHMEESVRFVHALHIAYPTPLTIPLAVVTHGTPDMFTRHLSAQDALQAEERWQRLQTELAKSSTQGTLIVAQQSGHKIHIEEPEVVVNAIQKVVQAIQYKEKE